ncbi:hypothetical protein AKJ65_05095 [candidate division MSBL1 archaeon SCGC-AAA259E19]|uniref:Uncharacterized protein n=1 Tax=candidate division MSBL1 archaeon SCGC-AAA259E19 TaxID=1698264 RepID=A0A133UJ06_9EURY|nr:hypothetical protein AKJ65_05095 [candidate division MSBL1 archaeon SCGC-AAA259E19]
MYTRRKTIGTPKSANKTPVLLHPKEVTKGVKIKLINSRPEAPAASKSPKKIPLGQCFPTKEVATGWKALIPTAAKDITLTISRKESAKNKIEKATGVNRNPKERIFTESVLSDSLPLTKEKNEKENANTVSRSPLWMYERDSSSLINGNSRGIDNQAISFVA